MVKKLYWQNQTDVGLLKEEIVGNRVVISSTDTVYGFLGNITQESFNSICNLKGVEQARPFLILVSHKDLVSKVANFVEINSISGKTLKFIESCWPGPVTFIFKAKNLVQNGGLIENSRNVLPVRAQLCGSLDFLSGGRETIAIRCPDHAGLQELLAYFDGLFSTSANKAGMPGPEKFEDIDPDLLNSVNYVVLDAQDSSGGGISVDLAPTFKTVSQAPTSKTVTQASTIVDLSCPDYSRDFPFSIVRQGSFSVQKLHEIYNKLS